MDKGVYIISISSKNIQDLLLTNEQKQLLREEYNKMNESQNVNYTNLLKIINEQFVNDRLIVNKYYEKSIETVSEIKDLLIKKRKKEFLIKTIKLEKAERIRFLDKLNIDEDEFISFKNYLILNSKN